MITQLNASDFCIKVYDYHNTSKIPVYKGLIPAIVLFHTTGPYFDSMYKILEEISALYDSRILFYAVDVNTEIEIATELGMRAIPTLVLIPLEGSPGVIAGVFDDKVILEKIITQMPLPGIAGGKLTKSLIIPG